MFDRDLPLFSEERRLELESGEFPNYALKTMDELKDEMRQRGLELRGRRKIAHFVKALTDQDSDDIIRYREWKQDIESYKELQKRPYGMLASAYKSDDTRKTFLDLPGELRNMVYEYALFWPDQFWKLEILSVKRQIMLFERDLGQFSEEHELAISTLYLLGATSKQICTEARALFWAKAKLHLRSVDAYEHKALNTFLLLLDPDSRASLPELRLNPSPGPNLTPEGHAAFQSLLSTLNFCKNLRSLGLQLCVSNVFRSDVDALKTYFIAGEPLVSPRLNKLAATIESLPLLKTLNLKFKEDCGPFKILDPETERFLYFAFSGMREVMLWTEIKERLRAKHIKN
jgi:hypothetical protein